jgi:DNA-binding MarR family transcriptional regulator
VRHNLWMPRARTEGRKPDRRKPRDSDPLVAEAAGIARALRELRRYVERPTPDVEERRRGLTTPQISTVTVLFDQGPLSLKELSRELGLSHSTVSGIVDRLERHGLVQRSVEPSDRRITRISVTREVDAYARRGYLESQVGRLLPVLRSATEDQRRLIKDGLALLQALIAEQAEDEGA